ncbi:MAG: bacteriohemerythrin [Thermodesulfobacteriota bacterium]
MSINLLNNLRIRTKLYLGFGVVLGLILFIGIYSITVSNNTKREITTIENVTLRSALATMNMRTAVNQTQQWLTDISATRGRDGLDDGFEKAEKWAGKFREELTTLKSLFKDDTVMISRLEAIGISYNEYYVVGVKMAKAYVAGGPAKGNMVMSEFDESAERINNAVEQLTEKSLGSLDTTLALLHDWADHAKILSMLLLAGAILICIVLSTLIARAITGPINKTTAMLKDISEGDGDLTKSIDVHSNDEIGELARYFNTFLQKLQTMIGEIKSNAGTLAEHSQNLYTSSSQMEIDTGSMSSNAKTVAATSGEVTTNVETVASSAEVASANVTNVSAATEEVSHKIVEVASTTKDILSNVHTVAAAIEEMSSTVSEITKNTTKAAGISTDATEKAAEAEVLMKDLSASAETVGKVIEVINDIADRTNLLALNATIEAASAGEAGKGFAVVANEVKELAKQTAEATKEVVTQIEEMQGNTEVAVKAIDNVASTINEINEINTSIAASVEEQDATTNEISKTTVQTVTDMEAVSRNVEEAALGAEEVAKNASELSCIVTDISNNVQEAAGGVKEVSEGIQVVEDASMNTLDSVKEVHQSIDNLSTVTGNLNDLVGQFIIDESYETGTAVKGQARQGRPRKGRAGIKPFIAWNDRYSVGVKAFDTQHRRLFDLINDVHEAMAMDSGKERMGSILNELIDYTENHFSEEEKLMQKAGYEGYEEQRAEHTSLVEELLAFKSNFDSGAAKVDLKLMSFLKNWLTKHIMGTDMKYKSFFSNKGRTKVA